MSTGRAVQRLNITNKQRLRSLFAVHLQLSFVPTYRSARYLFIFYPQAGIIGKTILAIVKLQKLPCYLFKYVSTLTILIENSANLTSSWFTVRLWGLTDERNDMSIEIIPCGFYRSYISTFANLTTSVF